MKLWQIALCLVVGAIGAWLVIGFIELKEVASKPFVIYFKEIQ